jgi:regulator of ribonuclease activity A|tara:strand:- start:37 stop:516 length:480 start_codon:yes stop_codon:yes gene_type:complete
MPYITPDLCDQYPDVEVFDVIFNNYGGKKSFGGEVVTVKCFEDNSIVKELVSTPGEGKVMVVDGGGSLRAALLGDMLAEKAVKNGWQGFIIFGCIRDIDVIKTLDIGVQALNIHPRKTEKRGLGDLNVDLTFAGVSVKPGMYVYADNNGIIVSRVSLSI